LHRNAALQNILRNFLRPKSRNGKARLRRVAFHSDRVQRMRFTSPLLSLLPSHLARRAMNEFHELMLSNLAAGGSFRMRTFVVHTEE
jgi:hypothetical protein